MARAVKQDKQTRNRYSDEYKSEALALATRMGVANAAKQLGLNQSQLYAWRGKARRDETQGEAERRLNVENARLKRQLADQAEELAILKKGGGVLRETPDLRYAFMNNHTQEFRLTTMCRALSVSRSGFYAWRKRRACPQSPASAARHTGSAGGGGLCGPQGPVRFADLDLRPSRTGSAL